MIARRDFLFLMAVLFAAVLVIPVQAKAVPTKARKDSTIEKRENKHKHHFYTKDELTAIFRHSPRPPLPPDPTNRHADNPRAAVLGQALFFDRRLSASHKVSCASCHFPHRSFTDGRRFIRKITPHSRNTPSLINVAFNSWFFWDGRSDSLWAQALAQIENPEDLNANRLQIVHIVATDPQLAKAYRKIFGSFPKISDSKRVPQNARPDANPRTALSRAWKSMTILDQTKINQAFSNLGKAIEAYERKLVSHGAPFDRYVSGLKTGSAVKKKALSPAAKRGLKLFVGAARCDVCHSGPNFTDGGFHNPGLPLLSGKVEDPGRAEGIRRVLFDPFNRRGRYSDDRNRESGDRFTSLPAPETRIGAFRTPSLRNVALTAPYMHDGRFSSLTQVLDFYSGDLKAPHGRLVGKRDKRLDQIPHLSSRQKSDIIAFLKTLSDRPLPLRLRRPPAHP